MELTADGKPEWTVVLGDTLVGDELASTGKHGVVVEMRARYEGEGTEYPAYDLDVSLVTSDGRVLDSLSEVEQKMSLKDDAFGMNDDSKLMSGGEAYGFVGFKAAPSDLDGAVWSVSATFGDDPAYFVVETAE